MKACKCCGEVKQLAEFYGDKSTPDLHRRKCKDCDRKTNVSWREQNKSHLKEYVYKWRGQNKDAYHAINAKSRLKNHARVMVDNGKRRAIEKRATPIWADLKLMRSIYQEARNKSTGTGLPYHVDHIVPLKSRFVCGLHVEHNLQVLPALDNCLKNNRTWPDMPEKENYIE